MTKAELRALDVADGLLQTVQAGGRVHVVVAHPDIVGRWTTVTARPTMREAQAFIDSTVYQRNA